MMKYILNYRTDGTESCNVIHAISWQDRLILLNSIKLTSITNVSYTYTYQCMQNG